MSGARGRRIGMVTSSLPRWEGDSTTPFVLHLARDLTELGWEVRLLAPHAPGAARREVLGGVPVERFRYLLPESAQTVCYQGGALVNLREHPGDRLKLPPLVMAEWWALTRRLLRGEFDLVHSHWVLPQGFVGALACGPLRVPHVVTVHGGDLFGLKGRFLEGLKRFALVRAAAVTVNSSATEAAVRRIAPRVRRLRRIPMGVGGGRGDPPQPGAGSLELRARHRRGEGPLLAFVGRLVEEKGLGDLLLALAELRGRLPDLRLLVLGEGQHRAVFERACRDLGLTDRVSFLGWVAAERVADHLRAADLFVGPSRTGVDGWVEAQGLTFLEAMQAGVPVVATRSGGIPDVVVHEQTGLLVPERAPAELAAAIERLHRDRGLASRLAKTAGERVREGFTRAGSAAAFSRLFQDLLDPCRAQAAPAGAA